jgi:hypothetical protein
MISHRSCTYAGSTIWARFASSKASCWCVLIPFRPS